MYPPDAISRRRTALLAGILPLVLTTAALMGCRSSAPSAVDSVPGEARYRIIGYVMGSRPLDLTQIAAEKLTHINYAFANVRDHRVVLERPQDPANLAKLQALKARNPSLKILLSVGGWSWSDNFSDAALMHATRDTFARSAAAMASAYALDGIDIDWEYPAQPGEDNVYRPEDKENFTLMLRALREHLDAQSAADGRTGSDRYLLTIASNGDTSYIENTELGKAQRHLDFINIMTYDFHGGWSPTTGHHTNLYPSASGDTTRSADDAVRRHLAAGVPPEKLVLGVAFYGRGWAGAGSARRGLHQPFASATGAYPYDSLAAHYIDQNGFTRQWDDEAQAPFLWNPDSGTFITYDDETSLQRKAEYVQEQGLGGIMFWENSHDPSGRLLDVLYRTLHPDG